MGPDYVTTAFVVIISYFLTTFFQTVLEFVLFLCLFWQLCEPREPRATRPAEPREDRPTNPGVT